ncbi:two-component system sensor histidine kinase NtrB [Desulfolucanica intricata]|uniref:two-component system sensor histidine kinase NtrB n=1 Tax=Desulfolucanica intricata TaxID=1285191 RepID=UPI00082C848B|nr:ATP-binding protein [Desulfolucanica intricata]
MTDNFFLDQQVIQFFYEKMNSGVIFINAQGNIQYINRQCEKITNVKLEEALGQKYSDVFAHLPADEWYTLITLETGKEFKNIQHIHNGMYLVTDTSLLKNGNKIIGAVGIIKDVSEIRNMEKKLEKTEREKEKLAIISQMAAGMAHEIKNPLTAVRGFAQLLKHKYCDNDTLAKYAKIIMDEVDQATRVITDFLQLARPKEPELMKQSIHSLIEEIIAIVEPRASYENIVVKYKTQKDLPDCTFDRNQIKQVLLNLCKNATEAMPEGGVLTIKTGYLQGKNEIYIDILDTGCGIPHKCMENLGVPFYTTKANGTGLGLSISYSIIHAHRGRIEVYSKEGVGTRFHVCLPCESS